MIAASVVVFPEPVAPVTRIRPRCSSASRRTPSGMLSCSKLGTVFGMTRKAKEVALRWRYALTRKRGSSPSWYAMSRSPKSWKCWSFSGARLATISRTAASSAWSNVGASCIGIRSPSTRQIGGWPILRWTSVAPSSTARVSRPFKSMRTRTRDRPEGVRALAQRGLEGAARVAGASRNRVDEPDRALLEAACGARVPEVSLEHLLEDPERDRQARERVGRSRKALEGQLRSPAGSRERRDAARDGLFERLEAGCAPGEHVERRLGDELRGEKGLVHAVARERVDEPGGVPDHRGDLEHHRPGVTRVVREVGLECYTVHDLSAETERTCGGAVAAVGADHDACRHFLAVHRQSGRAHVGDLDAVAHVGPRFRRLLHEELVEPEALRHERERCARLALEAPAVVEAAFQRVDDFLDHGIDGEGQDACSAPGDAAAARLVAREGRAVDEQDACARARQTVGRGRSGGPGAGDRDVERAHEPKATMARPGGVPERPKGTGCKPVGSAYGGSNPPAPIHSFTAGCRARARCPTAGSPPGTGRSGRRSPA